MEWEAITGVVGIIGLIIMLVIHLLVFSNKFGKFENSLKHFGEGLKHITGDIKDISKILTRIEGNQRSIATFLTGKYGDFPTSLYKTESPITLTQLGKEFLNDIGGKKFVDENLEELISLMEERNYKSALDVENFASFTIAGVASEWDAFTSVKNFIYNNPEYKSEPLSLGVASKLIGIYLRDKYFEKHPELKNVS